MKKLITMLFIGVVILGMGTAPIYAAEDDTSDEAISVLLEDGYEILEEDENTITLGKSLEAENISPMVPVAYAWPGYSARNFKAVSKTAKTSIIVKSATLAKNGSNTYSLSYTGTTTVSGSAAIGASDINVTLGMSSSASVTVSDTYNYACSYTKCSLSYYPEYTNYTWDEYLLGINNGQKRASVLTGFYQSVKITK